MSARKIAKSGRPWAWLAVALLLVSGAGCGWWSKEEAEPAGPVDQARALTPASTRDVLRLAPEGTAIAAAMPGLSDYYNRGVALMKNLATPGFDIDALVAQNATELGAPVGVVDPRTHLDIAFGLGLDPEEPLGFFVRSKATPAQEAPEAAEAPEAPGAPETEDSAEEGILDDDAEGGFFDEDAEAVALVTVSDAALAEKALQASLVSNPEIDPSSHSTEEAHGVTLHDYGTALSYFVTDRILVVGNSPAMVREVAARRLNPRELRYGTEACPEEAPGEWVVHAWGKALAPALEASQSLLETADASFGGIGAMSMLMGNIELLEESDDPLVMTMHWDDEGLHFISRIDNEAHTKMVELAGPAAPLALAARLPVGTGAFLGMRLTPQFRGQLHSQLQSIVPPPMQDDPSVQAGVDVAARVVGVLGDEIGLGVTGMTMFMPQAVAMLKVADPDGAKELLSEFGLLTEPIQTHNGVDIMQYSLQSTGLPMQIPYAFVGDAFVVGTDLIGMQAAIGRLQAEGPTDLYKSLAPPLDPAQPLYSVFYLDGAFLQQALGPLLMMSPPDPASPVDPGKALRLLRQIRMVQGVESGWTVTRMSVLVNAVAPPEGAVPSVAAADVPRPPVCGLWRAVSV